MDTDSSMAVSTTITNLPMGSQAKGSLSSRAIKSVPPVVAPLEKMIPSAAPRLTPPKMAASMGSIEGNSYRTANKSTRMEVAAMASREDTRVCPPRYFHPKRKIGILSTSTTVPMGTAGERWLRIMPRAVRPPKPI